MIRPTARGLGTAVGSGILLLAAVLLGYRELFVLGAAGLVAVAVCAAWSLVTPAMVVDRVVAPDRVQRGRPAESVVDIVVRGRLGRALRLWDGVRDEHGRQVSASTTTEVVARPGLPTRIRLRLPTDRRGVFRVGPLRVGRADPLGLWSALRPVGAAERLVVWPVWHPLTGSAVGRTSQIDAARDSQHTESVTFHTLREYVSGDDLRHIHWRTSARMGTLMIRRHEGASVARTVLLVDDRADSYAEAADFEEAVEVAASVLVSAMDDGRRITVVSASDPAREPVTSVTAGLDLLAAARLSGAGTSDERIRARLRLEPSGDALILVTGSAADATLARPLTSRYRSVRTVVIGTRSDVGATSAVIAAPSAGDIVARLRDRR